MASRWIVGLFTFALLMAPAVLLAKGVARIFGGNEAVYSWTLIPLGIATPISGALALRH